MRPISFERNYIIHPEGSCLAAFGNTKVICTASIQWSVPRFLVNSDRGWITGEYAMLPGSTGGGRKRREIGRRDGRSTEIQRLIGRSLRSAVDLGKLDEVTVFIDCDVLQADGGTRTAAVSGGWVALYDALAVLAEKQDHSGPEFYLAGQVAAVSVGIVDGDVHCDLDYNLDSNADVDMNVIMRDDRLVEVQGTGEQDVFTRDQLALMLDTAEKGIEQIQKSQRSCLGL